MATEEKKITDKKIVKPIEDYTAVELLAATLPWTEDDFVALRQTALDVNCNPYDLIKVLMSESMLNPQSVTYSDPKTKKIIGIVGLNQFTKDAVIDTFYPEMIDPSTGKMKDGSFKKWQEFAHAYVKMSPAEQFPFITKFLNKSIWRRKKPFEPFPNATTLYLTNFQPGLGLITDPNYVIYSVPDAEKGCPKGSTSLYCQNKGIDMTHDGKITIGDIGKFLERGDVVNSERYNALVRRYKAWEAGQKIVLPPMPNVSIPDLPTPVSDATKPLDIDVGEVKTKLAPSLSGVDPNEISSYLGGNVPKEIADSIPGFPGGALPAVPGLPEIPGFAASGEDGASNAKFFVGALAAGAVATSLYFMLKKSGGASRSRQDEIADRYRRQLQMRGAYS